MRNEPAAGSGPGTGDTALYFLDFRDPVDLREADLREADFREDDLRAVDLRDDDLRDDDLREADLRGGTFAPARRASESPIAIACLRLFTFLPARPLFKEPRFRSCITSRTFSDAFLPYLAMIASSYAKRMGGRNGMESSKCRFLKGYDDWDDGSRRVTSCAAHAITFCRRGGAIRRASSRPTQRNS